MPCLLRKKEHKDVVIECLESVKLFSPGAELIVVDDGSPLSTKFLNKYADLVIHHTKSKGIAFGWNNGIKLAKGDYIVVINDDIVARPGWIEAMLKGFETEGAMVTAPSVEHMAAGTGIKVDHTWFPGSCFMLSKKTIKEIGYFDEQFAPFNYEDVDYWTRICKAGGKMVRNYAIQVRHKEGDVIHKFEGGGEINDANRDRYIKKWGFDPIKVFYWKTDVFPWQK